MLQPFFHVGSGQFLSQKRDEKSESSNVSFTLSKQFGTIFMVFRLLLVLLSLKLQSVV